MIATKKEPAPLMTIQSLLLLQLLLERLQIPQKGVLKLEKSAVLHATFKDLCPV